jgi:hypothetical protein
MDWQGRACVTVWLQVLVWRMSHCSLLTVNLLQKQVISPSTSLTCFPRPPPSQELTEVLTGSEPCPAPTPLAPDELGGTCLRLLHQLATHPAVQEALAMAQVRACLCPV